MTEILFTTDFFFAFVQSGFYTLDPQNPSQLILAPFQGKPACQMIALGRGVCGSAAVEKKVLCVRDVTKFAGHIACDDDTRSEIVVPIVVGEKVSFGAFLLSNNANGCMWKR